MLKVRDLTMSVNSLQCMYSQQYIAEDAVSLLQTIDVRLPTQVFGEVGGFRFIHNSAWLWPED